VEQDNVAAYAWLNIAASNGLQNAQKGLLQVVKEMTPAQITEAEELVKEMVKKNPKLIKKP
jgi:TPR repeat protein